MYVIETPRAQVQALPPTLAPRRRSSTAAPVAVAAPSLTGDTTLQRNYLLAALPPVDLQRWSHQLELVDMPLGQVLYESGCTLNYVYFPVTAIISLQNLTADGACAEVATVGNDGMVGVPLLMGGVSTNGRAVVQSAGKGYRLRGEILTDEFNQGGTVMHLLLHYTQALLTQMAQTATCNRHHSIDQQVCRMILLSLDRMQGNSLHTTQELLAARLGVRRESVTAVALALQRSGLIRYSRGLIDVLDREALEDRACECYGVVKLECDRLRLLSPTRPAANNRWKNYQGAVQYG